MQKDHLVGGLFGAASGLDYKPAVPKMLRASCQPVA